MSLWPSLTGGQVLDTLAGLRGSRDRAREEELTERFDLDPTKKVRAYSKGNAQKVALVAALSAPVDLLILDEPTSGLDPLMERVFTDAIREAADAGTTVLLSSHILVEVQDLCSHVTIIKDGRTVESGDLSHLRSLAKTAIRIGVGEGDARPPPASSRPWPGSAPPSAPPGPAWKPASPPPWFLRSWAWSRIWAQTTSRWSPPA